MKIEHITIKGNTVIRDSRDIALYTLDFLKEMQVYNQIVTVDIPKTLLKVKITSAPGGAMFDIMKGPAIAFTNACCFSSDNKDEIIDLTQQLVRQLPFLNTQIIQQPRLDQFIYSIPVIPFSITPVEAMICGEIELYIYYSLYLAQKNE